MLMKPDESYVLVQPGGEFRRVSKEKVDPYPEVLGNDHLTRLPKARYGRMRQLSQYQTLRLQDLYEEGGKFYPMALFA